MRIGISFFGRALVLIVGLDLLDAPRTERLAENDPGEAHESRWSWALARRVLAWLHGDVSPDPNLNDVLGCEEARSLDALVVHEPARAELEQALRRSGTIVVTGRPGMGRRSLLIASARQAGLAVLVIDARRLATDVRLRSQCRDLLRECKLLRRAPLIVGLEAINAEALDTIGRELVARLDGAVLATSSLELPTFRWEKPTIVVELKPLMTDQRADLWLAALEQGTRQDGELLAGQYPLAPALVRAAATAARERTGPDGLLTAEHIAAGVRTVLDDKLGHLARRVEVTQTWDDLVLAEEQLSPILELLARVRERPRVYERWGFAAKVGKGLGTSALFSGPPGTGKTMVAALIARDLGIELYQVDLAKIVSKWIGETEKQLSALFDSAEAGHAILLFDEADSLFGKRTDVKSSNDRYANLESNYLLQRLESFTGICILTSNHESNIDPAFERRLSLHVRFELPNAAERERLWRATIPHLAPLDDNIDFGSLAHRYAMSGGYIRNASVRAAFVAASDNATISNAHLENAARLEYEGMGKLVA
ncbi:MAG TPA: ATP-binding protein [Kofleriaceae bacterium]|nr:ATP-binding protein [Kofleriaceae bacterium]